MCQPNSPRREPISPSTYADGPLPHASSHFRSTRGRNPMAYPSDLKYTKDHEWVRISGDTAEIGITDYAQQQLGDVVFVELPEPGATVTAGQSFGSIESVK